MSKETFIHAENNNKILSSNEVRLYVPPEPEKMKVIIWGKELCNGAEWYDFLKRVEEKTEENDQLKQQLAEKEEELLKQKEKSARTEQIYNGIIVDKDKEIEKLKFKLDIRAMSLQNINTERIESERNQTQLAIQELEKVKILLQNAVNYEGYTFVGIYDAVNNQIKELKGEKECND